MQIKETINKLTSVKPILEVNQTAYTCLIYQGDSDSDVILYFGIKFKLSVHVDLIQLLKVLTVWGLTLRHCHNNNCLWNSTIRLKDLCR